MDAESFARVVQASLSGTLSATRFLVELQASGEAWAMALSLLERPEPELQFYGSHMLYQKARSGRGNLTRENKVELATRLAEKIGQAALSPNQAKGVASTATERLCLAVVALWVSRAASPVLEAELLHDLQEIFKLAEGLVQASAQNESAAALRWAFEVLSSLPAEMQQARLQAPQTFVNEHAGQMCSMCRAFLQRAVGNSAAGTRPEALHEGLACLSVLTSWASHGWLVLAHLVGQAELISLVFELLTLDSVPVEGIDAALRAQRAASELLCDLLSTPSPEPAYLANLAVTSPEAQLLQDCQASASAVVHIAESLASRLAASDLLSKGFGLGAAEVAIILLDKHVCAFLGDGAYATARNGRPDTIGPLFDYLIRCTSSSFALVAETAFNFLGDFVSDMGRRRLAHTRPGGSGFTDDHVDDDSDLADMFEVDMETGEVDLSAVVTDTKEWQEGNLVKRSASPDAQRTPAPSVGNAAGIWRRMHDLALSRVDEILMAMVRQAEIPSFVPSNLWLKYSTASSPDMLSMSYPDMDEDVDEMIAAMRQRSARGFGFSIDHDAVRTPVLGLETVDEFLSLRLSLRRAIRDALRDFCLNGPSARALQRSDVPLHLEYTRFFRETLQGLTSDVSTAARIDSDTLNRIEAVTFCMQGSAAGLVEDLIKRGLDEDTGDEGFQCARYAVGTSQGGSFAAAPGVSGGVAESASEWNIILETLWSCIEATSSLGSVAAPMSTATTRLLYELAPALGSGLGLGLHSEPGLLAFDGAVQILVKVISIAPRTTSTTAHALRSIAREIPFCSGDASSVARCELGELLLNPVYVRAIREHGGTTTCNMLLESATRLACSHLPPTAMTERRQQPVELLQKLLMSCLDGEYGTTPLERALNIKGVLRGITDAEMALAMCYSDLFQTLAEFDGEIPEEEHREQFRAQVASSMEVLVKTAENLPAEVIDRLALTTREILMAPSSRIPSIAHEAAVRTARHLVRYCNQGEAPAVVGHLLPLFPCVAQVWQNAVQPPVLFLDDLANECILLYTEACRWLPHVYAHPSDHCFGTCLEMCVHELQSGAGSTVHRSMAQLFGKIPSIVRNLPEDHSVVMALRMRLPTVVASALGTFILKHKTSGMIRGLLDVLYALLARQEGHLYHALVTEALDAACQALNLKGIKEVAKLQQAVSRGQLMGILQSIAAKATNPRSE